MRGFSVSILALVLVACYPNTPESVRHIKEIMKETFVLQDDEIRCTGDKNNFGQFYCTFRSEDDLISMINGKLNSKLSSHFLEYDGSFRKNSAEPFCISYLGSQKITYASFSFFKDSAISSTTAYKSRNNYCLEIYIDENDI